MRKNSKKQTAASQINGGKSRGPTSTEGKNKSRLNALKIGLFSKDLVVPESGESVEDFELFKAAAWDSVQPEGALQEMLTDDLVANWWRRQRVRRCESAELKRRSAKLKIDQEYLRSDEIEPLTFQFSLLLEKYQASIQSPPVGNLYEIATELEKVRRQLAGTSLGLNFLLKKVNAIKSEAESKGQISDGSVLTLRACVGLKNESTSYVSITNVINKTESAKAAERTRAGQSSGTGQTKEVEPKNGKQNESNSDAAEWDDAEGKAVLVSTIEDVALALELRKQLFESIETWRDKARFVDALLPADSSHDRFSRAETAFDRRFYRALAALLTITQDKNASKILP